LSAGKCGHFFSMIAALEPPVAPLSNSGIIAQAGTNIGKVVALDDAVAAFNRTVRIKGKTIIRVHP